MQSRNPNQLIKRLYAMIEQVREDQHVEYEDFIIWIGTTAEQEFKRIYYNSDRLQKFTKKSLLLAIELNNRYRFIQPEMFGAELQFKK